MVQFEGRQEGLDEDDRTGEPGQAKVTLPSQEHPEIP